MSKYEIVKIQEESDESKPLFDHFIEHDMFGELVDKEITIKVHRVGKNRILLDIPTNLADREEYFFGLVSAAVPLIKKGIKVYKAYSDNKKNKTPKPETFRREAEPKQITKQIVENIMEVPAIKKIAAEYPEAAQILQSNPENATNYFGEYLEEAEENGELTDLTSALYDEIAQSLIKGMK